MRRRVIILALAYSTLVAMCGGAFQCAIWPAPFKQGEGSPSYAKKWKARLEEMPDPESAKEKYKEIEMKRFADGEWTFGVCADSHSSIHGGTVVFKDSRGDALRRIF